jgi:hypothetical protein
MESYQMKTVTDEQIRALYAEATQAGDWDMADICEVALAPHDRPFNDCAADHGFTTRSEARAECARVIADAEAQS